MSAKSAATGPWVTIDLGYRGQFAAIGVDLGQSDLTELNLRVGNKTVVSGTENPLCLATIANLPGYSKTLFGCAAAGRYLTAQAPAATSLDVCLLSAYLQGADTEPECLGVRHACFRQPCLSCALAPQPIASPLDALDWFLCTDAPSAEGSAALTPSSGAFDRQLLPS